MINGAHSILFSTDPEADRAFLRDVLGLVHIDAGDGWLIFGLPPSELAVHPAEQSAPPELYLLCHDVEALVQTLELGDVATTPIEDKGWGLVTEITLPSGLQLPVYQPLHPRPPSPSELRDLPVNYGRSGAQRGRKASKTGYGVRPTKTTRTGRPPKTKKFSPAATPGKAAKVSKLSKANKAAKKVAKATKADKPAKASKPAKKTASPKRALQTNKRNVKTKR